MNKLETLQSLVAEWFNQAENKSDIEKLTAINNAAKEVAEEQNKLVAENRELLKDYKELVSHTSFNDQHKAPADPVGGTAVSFEDALQNFMKEIK